MSRFRTNHGRLIVQSVLGEVAPPRAPVGRHWRVDPDGVPHVLPGVGGITYNCKVGQSAVDWEADHVEPGVSVRAEKEDVNAGLNLLACVGNEARVLSGDAKGARGVVTGKHGGIEHVLVDFAQSVLEKLAIGDKVQFKACGLGLRLLDAPEVRVMNAAPDLLDAMGVVVRDGRVRVKVTHTVPAALMGSGLGAADALSGDYDIQLFDIDMVERYGLADLKLGDMVAIVDADHTYGRIFKSGAVSIGVVVHSCCVQAGHGPGVTTLLTSARGLIEPVRDARANIANHLKIGAARPAPRRRKGRG